MKIKRIILGALALIALVPLSALAFIKPLRLVAPQIVGAHCYDSVCTDDKARLGEAQALYSASVSQTSAKVGPFRSHPRIVFCSTTLCLDGFGLGARAAYTVGDFGIVVAPRGWQGFYIVHELIHYRQAEEFGNLAMRRKPRWLIEGMAYSLSDDPRRPLTEPFESWRARFDGWHAAPHSDFWQAANRAE